MQAVLLFYVLSTTDLQRDLRSKNPKNTSASTAFSSKETYSCNSERVVSDYIPLPTSGEVPQKIEEPGMLPNNKAHSSKIIRNAELRRLLEEAGDAVQDFGGVRFTRSQTPAAKHVSIRETSYFTNGASLPASDTSSSSHDDTFDIKTLYHLFTYFISPPYSLSDPSTSSTLCKEERQQSFLAELNK